jgi:hypothetical protein
VALQQLVPTVLGISRKSRGRCDSSDDDVDESVACGQRGHVLSFLACKLTMLPCPNYTKSAAQGYRFAFRHWAVALPEGVPPTVLPCVIMRLSS